MIANDTTPAPFKTIRLSTLVLGLAALCPALGHAADTPRPGQTPLDPKEARTAIRLPDDLRIDLVASDPQIESPVAMAFDERGRLWVVEMQDYPNGPPPGQQPAGRIKRLEDRDGDGQYETSHVFAENLLFANGLLPWKDGVIVTAAPHIVHLRDTDNDGRADVREVLFEGFATQNPQLRVSHPILGIDNWVYVANGLRGGQVRRPGKNAEPGLTLGAMDFRFDPNNPDRYEAISGMGQFGNTMDDWGRRFVCDNSHHLRHVVFPQELARRNPYLAVPAVLQDISELGPGPLSSGAKVYPISKNWTTSSLHAGRFTAACGVFFYRESLLPTPYRGCAFTCDPTGNLVHQEVVRPAGATFRSRPPREGIEFLASPDEWFRPVFLASGPDGALYVVDMCRAVIEHPEFMPVELKNRPDLTAGRQKGRIWRISPQKAQPTARQTLPAEASTAQLVGMLESPEAWWRTTAQRLLLQRNDPASHAPLAGLVSRTQAPLAKVHAAHLLEAMKQLSDEQVLVLLKSTQPEVRVHGLMLATPRLASAGALADAALAASHDGDGEVRYHAALALSALDDGRIVPALARIAVRSEDDPWTRLAAAAAAGKRTAEVFHALTVDLKAWDEQPTPARLVLLQDLLTLVGAQNDPVSTSAVLADLFGLQGPSRMLWQVAGLNGLATGMGRRGARLADFAQKREIAPEVRTAVTALFTRCAADAGGQADNIGKIEAIRLLAHAPWEVARQSLPGVLANDPDQEARLAAVRALGAHATPDVPEVVLKSWRAYSPALRREALEIMLRQPDRIRLLLAAVEAGRIKAADIDPPRTRQLLAHKDAAIRQQAERLLKLSTPEERKAILAEYRRALSIASDPLRGREVFKKHCATCHRVGGVGVDVGPDIADSRTKSPEQLLTDILLPNQAIDSNYINYTAQTKDGRLVTGVIAAETASSITLRRAENQTESILRQDLDAIQSTGLSLMPEGLEKSINVQELADVIAFVKNWRYLDGSIPTVSGDQKANASEAPIQVEETADQVIIRTAELEARVNKKGYVSGVAAGSLLDRKTGARDVGFGLHIMDFLLAPGWRDDGYSRDARLHGNLPKHYVEGPQICTQARKLDPEIIRGTDFVAVKLKYTFHQPAKGLKPGSQWVQTLLFKPGLRYFLSSEEITCANDVEDLFYRIDMPGHIKHQAGSTFAQVYLSYHGTIPASEFGKDFGPDEKHLYQRNAARPQQRMIRAYQVRLPSGPGPWLAGITLNPADVSEAWCHQRGYICMIQELHQKTVKAGDRIGAAYAVGWFDSVPEMERVADQYRGKSRLTATPTGFKLE